jgi:hypothetical protein
MMKVYFENEYVTIYYNLEQLCGMAAWKGELTGAEFREATLLCQDLIDRYGLIRWLGDNRKMKGIRKDDLLWFMEVMEPQLVNSSLLRMANLLSHHADHQEAMERLTAHGTTLNHRLIVRDYSNKDAALEWLLSPI